MTKPPSAISEKVARWTRDLFFFSLWFPSFLCSSQPSAIGRRVFLSFICCFFSFLLISRQGLLHVSLLCMGCMACCARFNGPVYTRLLYSKRCIRFSVYRREKEKSAVIVACDWYTSFADQDVGLDSLFEAENRQPRKTPKTVLQLETFPYSHSFSPLSVG